MNIETTVEEKATVLRVSGRMDAASSPEFEKACETAIGGATVLIVDLTGLDYVSSAGLRSFLVVAKSLQAKGGKLLISGMRGLVKEVFKMTQLNSVFPVHDSLDAALASL